MCECLILRKLVPSKVSWFWSEVGFCVKGGSLIFFISHRHHAETEGLIHTAPCCHITFHTGCNITVYNLLLSVPAVSQNPSRRQGRMYILPGLASPEGGWRSRYVACIVALADPPMLWEQKNCFTRALPTFSVPDQLGTNSVSVYIQI